MNFKRIHIFGINGSCKNFLGNAISKKLNLRHVELDHIFWRNKYDDFRSDEECKEKLREVCKDENWVVEGVFTTWVNPSCPNGCCMLEMYEGFPNRVPEVVSNRSGYSIK